MNIAIIGSNGLLSNEIGQFCDKRKDAISVWGLDKPTEYQYSTFYQINFMQQDIDAELLADNDVIIYAAGAGIQSNLNENYQTIYYLNTLLPIKLCKALAQNNFKGAFVTFGSCFEIGANVENILFDEQRLSNSLLHAPNDYSISKRLLTRFVLSNTTTFKHLHLILPTIYGPTEAAHRLIPYTLSMIDNNETPKFTAGTQIRQYLYIGDVPGILFSLTDKREQGVFNIAGTQRFSVKELVEILYSQRGKQIPAGIFGTAQRSDISMENLQLDDTKLRKSLSGLSFTPLLNVIPRY